MEFQEMYKPRKRVTVTFGPSKTKQAPREECDINVLMRRYLQGGALPVATSGAAYGEFCGPSELLDAYELVKRAEEQFAGLSSRARERFGNDPARFLAFVEDPKNGEEARKLGLLEPLPADSPELKELKRIADTVAERLVAPAKPPAP